MKHSLKILLTSAILAAAVLFGVAPARAKLATVGAAHDYVRQKWGVEIPRRRDASNIINMNYLMQLVDAANDKLNGWVTSDFATHAEYATAQLVGATTGKEAADTLIDKVEWKFFFTPAAATNEYSFNISAAGHFYIDWGDGEKEFICKKDVDVRTISHTYAEGRAASEYEIKLGGHATKYVTNNTAAISFYATAARLSAMRGCLGCVFSTIDKESVPVNQRQPRFHQTFFKNTALISEIPEELFNGIHGAPVSYMFSGLFWDCNNMPGTIPEKLFAGIQGAPAANVFEQTFTYCYKLTGDIPEKLFAGLQGPPAANMFRFTFQNDSGLSGRIENLFSGITPTDTYKDMMFYGTFTGLTKITGPSARIDGKYLYEIWSPSVGQLTYQNASNLDDYADIPSFWKNCDFSCKL